MKNNDIRMDAQDTEAEDTNALSLCIVSDITIEPYMSRCIASQFCRYGCRAKANHVMFQEYMEPENIELISSCDICVVWINYENHLFERKNSILPDEAGSAEISQYLSKLIEITHSNIKRVTAAQIIWVGFEDYYNHITVCTGNIMYKRNPVDGINAKLQDIVGGETCVIDLKRIIAGIGIAQAFDENAKYRWAAPYSEALLNAVAGEIVKCYRIDHGLTRKCIVLDCDNVLWKGTINEDGLDNIRLGGTEGRFYKEFQKYLYALYETGVILALCSKNDRSDVDNVFCHHPDMILTEDNISALKVNWNSKVENIKALAEMLNIGLEHMIFIDDSVFEIEAVNSMLPEVQTILFEKNTVYQQLDSLNLSLQVNPKDIELKKNTYHTNELRQKLKEVYEDYSEYLHALDMKVKFDNLPANLFRVSELSQRVNKLTNGKRYSIAELEALTADKGYHLHAINVSDKFGDLGLVGAIGILEKEGSFILDLFCLSCRALGRNVEERMIDFIKEKYVITDFYFKSTHKNDKVYESLSKAFEAS